MDHHDKRGSQPPEPQDASAAPAAPATPPPAPPEPALLTRNEREALRARLQKKFH
jgi:hypothetical protein